MAAAVDADDGAGGISAAGLDISADVTTSNSEGTFSDIRDIAANDARTSVDGCPAQPVSACTHRKDKEYALTHILAQASEDVALLH